MDFTGMVAAASLSGIGAMTRSGVSGNVQIGTKNARVNYRNEFERIYTRRLRIFSAVTASLTDSTGVGTVALAYTAPTAQVETATAAGTVTVAGNASVVVTGGGLASPVTLAVPVAASDTASAWAAKVRTALAANALITAKMTVGGSTTAIVLTRIVDDYGYANDATMNIALATGTATGITTAATSANTTAGVLAVGAKWDDPTSVDGEGLTLVSTAGAYALMIQGVRGVMAYTATMSTDLVGKVNAGAFHLFADSGPQIFDGTTLQFSLDTAGVAEVLITVVVSIA